MKLFLKTKEKYNNTFEIDEEKKLQWIFNIRKIKFL